MPGTLSRCAAQRPGTRPDSESTATVSDVPKTKKSAATATMSALAWPSADHDRERNRQAQYIAREVRGGVHGHG